MTSLLRTRLLAGVGALTLAVSALLAATPGTPAQAAPAPNPWARTTITKIYDGTSHGTSAQTFINSDNGYVPGDDTATDGVVASGDTVGYAVDTVIEGGPARTVQVVFELPDYLTFDEKLNAGLCQGSTFVKAAFVTVDGNPGCNYTVSAGVGASVQQNLILTAKDTAGTAQYDQVPTASVRVLGQPVYSTSAAESVTVVSAPTADLVLRPETCSVAGVCGSVESSVTGGAFEVMVEPLRWPGYTTTKGASTLTPWSAQLDVSAFPAGTTWSVDGVALTPVGGLLPLNNYTGNKTVSFEVPANWGGDEFTEGESRRFDAHLVVPSTAFSTPDFDNNGIGWQPGDGEPKGVSTLNMRDTGARRGYVYANNDHTAYQVYKPVPVFSPVFTKIQTRPWDSTDTLWGDGNMLFAEGEPQWVRSTQPNAAKFKYWDMVPGTELMSQVMALTQNITGVTETKGLIISDQWDTTYVVADPSREAYVTGPDGAKITTGFTMQWSKSVTGAAVVDPSDAGWITSNKPMAGAKSARVIFDSLPAGTAAGAGVYSFHVPTVVRTDLIEPIIPQVTDDRMYGWCETCTADDDFVAVPVSIVTMATPTLGIDVSADAVVLDRSTNKVAYTVAPTVEGLMDAGALINGTLTVSLDPCIIDIAMDAASPWEIVNQDMSLSCGEIGSNTVTLKLKNGFLPSTDLTDGKAQLPKLVFSATYSALAEDSGSVTALWDLTSIDGQQAVKLPDVVEVSDSAAITIPVRSSAGQAITTSTPKVEITDPLKFQATVEAKIAGQSAATPTQTVVVLPGKGDDAAFVSGLSGYTGAESSDFNGTYTLSSVTIDTDNSVSGTEILCTEDANPSLDPSVGNWSSACGPNTTAIKIVQPGGDNAGVSVVDIELTAVDNKVGDLYLAWIGPVTGEGITAGRSWPAQDVVVSSDIDGYVYWDTEGRGVDRTPDSSGIEGVTVELLDKSGSVIATTTTDADGFYEFLGYHSGDYTTRIPTIGATGGVPVTLDSEFYPDKKIDVTQTYSFRGDRLVNAKTQSDTIPLGIDTRFTNVNFGFHAPDPYSDLMKSVSKVDCPDDPGTVCDVTWDVTVKNPSKMTLTGGKLTDSTSSAVYDLEAKIGESVVKVIERTSGGYALTTSGDVYSWGYGLYGANGSGSTTNNLTAQLVQGLPSGSVAEVVARATNGGYALTTSGDVYAWGFNWRGGNGNGSDTDNLTAQLVLGLPSGGVAEVVARDNYGGYALTTSGDVYAWGYGGNGSNGNGSSNADNLTAQLVQGLPSGGVVEVVNRDGYGGYALTTSGDVYAWGRGSSGANGNGSTTDNLTAQLVQGLPSGGVAEVVARTSYGGYALTTSGDVYAWGAGSSSALPWMGNSEGWNGNGSDTDNLTAQLVQGLPSGGVAEVVERGNFGGYALTTSGDVYSWGRGSSGANGNGSTTDNLTAQLVQGLDFDTVMLQPITKSTNGSFTTREYQLPNIAPGETVTVTLTGKVNKPSFETNSGLGLVIGNQAWETFDQTPRLAPTLPEPNLPTFDPSDPTAAGKWTGNDTCTATEDWVVPGDQCDQVYASVPTTNQLLGALEGYTWHDVNRDGVMAPEADEPRLVGVKVTLWKGTNGEFTTKAGEAITDAEGYYKFSSLVPSTATETDGYYVTFSPVANPETSNGEPLLTEGESWTWTTPYDQAPWYAVDRSASHNGMTHNVPVVGGATTTPVNGGVVVHAPAIEVSKGYLNSDAIEAVHTPALDADKPGWTVTTPVTVRITNTGEEALGDLVFTDTLLSGEQVDWAQCTIGETTVQLTGAWTDGVYSFAFDPALSLAVGESMTCTGTVPAMTTDSTVLHIDTVKVDGVGTITGKPVTDDSTFTVNPPSPAELPTPAITLEKGILFPLVAGTDCTDPANAKDATKCGIDPGVATLDGGVSQRITFRVTNTGEETLLDMALDDVTVVGDAEVEDLTCQWDTTVIDDKTRRYLPVGGVALCSGMLTLPNTPDPSDHKNEAEVTAVGHISRTVVTDEAEFTARSRFNVALPEIPLTGGTGTALLIGGGLGVLALAAATFLVRRKRDDSGNLTSEGESDV